ncbi:hypothetical protein EG68_01045 [Paragonimus skrjabini miyazakii]|uniref:Uncharacterized protein n=1 Tax=Paragonimus skrjabini miyazakii TaxID=59628 RepID=A0A8S9Z8Y0_9TREM|nr:hypothetical protein EG68_01045 [Paragonimus skrjabini miyazakii]
MFSCLDDYVKRMSAVETSCSNEQPEEHRVGVPSVNECALEDSRSQLMTLLEEKRKRGVWASSAETVLSCSGYSIGLGNFLRFPYLAVSQGGGAFLIPYTVSLFLVGIPLFFMELAIAQFSGLGPLCVFNLVPVFTGIGWCMLAVSFIECIYYNVMMAWIIYYFCMSFQWNLPWSHCNNTWNTPNCFIYEQLRHVPSSWFNSTTNGTFLMNGTIYRSAAEEFWLFNVLKISEGIEQMGGINWKMASYVTAIMPCLFLTIILIRGVTLPGAWMGIKFFLVPAWSKLASLQIWSQAALQIFFSLGPSWGGLIAVASYNKYDHPIMRDSIVLPLIFSLSSIYGGFAIFSVIGNLMYLSGVDSVQTFVRQGHGLAFVTYPEALNHLPGSAVWSVLFFAMLFTQGLDTQFIAVDSFVGDLVDLFPSTIGKHKELFLIVFCLVETLLGIPFVTQT